ncbi:MAG: hypothetical protein ACYTGL_09270 [Planctomycetota bacterium]
MNVLSAVSFVLKVCLELIDVLPQWSLGVLFKRVEPTGLLKFDFLHELIEHGLGCGLVFRQRNTFFDAEGVSVAAPPFGGFAFDLLSGLTVSFDDLFLVETGH